MLCPVVRCKECSDAYINSLFGCIQELPAAASSAKVMQQDDLYAARERTEVQTMVFKKDGKVYGSIESVVGEHCQNGGIAFLIVCYIAEVRKLRRIRE